MALLKVIVESPYAGDVVRNVAYAKMCVKDCLLRGEAPIASHLLLTQPGILDDTIPQQRELGILAGHAWHGVADKVVVYTDLGFSRGMDAGIRAAVVAGTPIECRTLKVDITGFLPQTPLPAPVVPELNLKSETQTQLEMSLKKDSTK